LTMPPPFLYTIGIMTNKGDIMILKLKRLGLLDSDFVQPILGLGLLIVLGQVL
jgi:hypothetical protein